MLREYFLLRRTAPQRLSQWKREDFHELIQSAIDAGESGKRVDFILSDMQTVAGLKLTLDDIKLWTHAHIQDLDYSAVIQAINDMKTNNVSVDDELFKLFALGVTGTVVETRRIFTELAPACQISPNVGLYLSIFTAALPNSLDKAMQCYRALLASRLDIPTPTFLSMIDQLLSVDAINSSMELLDDYTLFLRRPRNFTIMNPFITYLAEKEEVTAALEVYKQCLAAGYTPNSETYDALIGGMLKRDETIVAKQLCTEAQARNIPIHYQLDKI